MLVLTGLPHSFGGEGALLTRTIGITSCHGWFVYTYGPGVPEGYGRNSPGKILGKGGAGANPPAPPFSPELPGPLRGNENNVYANRARKASTDSEAEATEVILVETFIL